MISTAILFYAALAASLLLSLVGLFAALREPGLRFRLQHGDKSRTHKQACLKCGLRN